MAIAKLPHPDSAEMGMLIDRWLTSLRQAGACEHQLELYARDLARSTKEYQLRKRYSKSVEIIQAFSRFVETEASMTTPK